MILTGSVVNGVAIVIGGLLGMLLHKHLPKRLGDTVMSGLALCVIFLGVQGSLGINNPLIAILSVAIGGIIGEGIDFDKHLNTLGDKIQSLVKSKDGKTSNISDGFVTYSLLACVGAMAIIGSLESGLMNNHDTLFAKSLLDFVAAVIMGSAMGVGVPLAGILCFAYEAVLTLSAQLLNPLLTDTIIGEMSGVGSVILIGVGVNMLFPRKIKVMNLVPAIFLPIILCRFI